MAESVSFHQPAPQLPKESRVVLPARLRRMSSKGQQPPVVEAEGSSGAVRPVEPERSSGAARPVGPRAAATDAFAHRPGPRGGEDYRMLTTEQAYRAAYHLISLYQERSDDPDTEEMLRWMSIMEDGITADPAFWPDWLSSVDKVLEQPPAPGSPLGQSPSR